jgi:hypothetical protein
VRVKAAAYPGGESRHNGALVIGATLERAGRNADDIDVLARADDDDAHATASSPRQGRKHA